MRAISFIFSDVFKGIRNVMLFSAPKWQAKCQSLMGGPTPPSYCEDGLTQGDETQEKCCCPLEPSMILLYVADYF